MKFRTFVSALALGSAILSPIANASEREREPIRPISYTPKEGTKLPEVDVDPASCPISIITVTVWTDYYAGEITWDLQDACDGNTTVLSGGPYVDNSTEHTHNYCTDLPLGAGSYWFNIYDTYGDGLGCGDGNYTVTYDGQIVVSGGGDFGYDEFHPINGTCEEVPTEPPTPAPTPCPSSNVTVTVVTDNWPEETSWDLVDLCDDNTTVLAGSNYSDYQTEYTDVYCTELPLGVGSFMFNFYDSYGDGLENNFTVTYDGEVVVSDGGDFGYNVSDLIDGTCEGTPTEAPTYSSDGCKDSPLEFQLIPEGGGKVSYKCAYLKSKDDEDPIYTKAKCADNPLLASHCPKSCGACATQKCEDSIAKFYKGGKKRTCEDDKILEKCDSGSVKKTCRETCSFCE